MEKPRKRLSLSEYDLETLEVGESRRYLAEDFSGASQVAYRYGKRSGKTFQRDRKTRRVWRVT